MTDWPKLDELKQLLDADPEAHVWDGYEDGTRMTRLLNASIAMVKADVGSWDDTYDTPTDGMAQAALRAAQLLAPPTNQAPEDIARDPIYAALMFGNHRRYGIS